MFDIDIMSVFAKLLSRENITLVVKNNSTASFDLRSRTLTIPEWDFSDEHLQKLLVAHECAHAIFTPSAWHTVLEEYPEEERRAFHGYLNVVEDCRIDKLIQAKYPGLKRSYYNGCKTLYDQDFFGLQKRNTELKDLSLINRINVHFKTYWNPNNPKVPFVDAEENSYVDRIMKIAHWGDVVQIAKELYEKDKKESADTLHSSLEHSEPKEGEGEGEGAEGQVKKGDEDGNGGKVTIAPGRYNMEEGSESDNGKKNSTQVDDNLMGSGLNDGPGTLYAILRKKIDSANVAKVAVNYGHRAEISKKIRLYDNAAMAKLINNDWWKQHNDAEIDPVSVKHVLRKFNNYIQLFTSGFERKKRAREYLKMREDKTGELNTNLLYSYKYNEDVFRTNVLMDKQKNHGFVFLVDCSGSMSDVFNHVMTQFAVFGAICDRLSIPYRGYGFTDVNSYIKSTKSVDNFSGHSVGFLNIMDSRDTKSNNLKRLERAMSGAISLGGTPLGDSLYYMRSMLKHFREETKVDVVNFVILTDGGDGSGNYYKYLIDNESNAMISGGISPRGTFDNTKAMYDIFHKVLGVNVIYIDITDHFNQNAATNDNSIRKFEKDGYVKIDKYCGTQNSFFIKPSKINPKERKLIDLFVEAIS